MALIEGIERIRFTTSHPREFNERLIEAYARVPKLANHLHLPVQSGSDRILTLMKRGHTVAEYQEKIRALREVRPDISISTDLIVGFPGETEADFAATMQLIEAIGFDQSFSFVYSPRPGTPAAALADPVSEEEKLRRLGRAAGEDHCACAVDQPRHDRHRTARAGRAARRARIRASLRARPATTAG